MSSLAESYQRDRISYILNQYEKAGTLRAFGSYLPNLRYKNNNIYYYSSNPIKLKSSKSKLGYYYQREFKLDNLQLYDEMTTYGITYYIEILPKYLTNGLEISVKYSDPYDILHKYDQKKIARAIEFKILGINIFKDYYNTRLSNTDDNFDITDILYDKINYYDNSEVSSALTDVLFEESIENSIKNTLSLDTDTHKINYDINDN